MDSNINPFRWKSFYFDAETGLYYANGSYYDPETGLYLNAAPMESIADKAFVPKGIDRNAPLCNNILELAGNPFTIETTVELTADGTYDVLDDLSGLDRLQYKVQLSIEKFFNWLNKQNVWVRLGVGAFFFSLAVGITVLTGGSVGALFVGLALGIGFAIIGYLFSCLCGNEFSWIDFTNVVVNTFLITSFFTFVSAGISATRLLHRTRKAYFSDEFLEWLNKGDANNQVYKAINQNGKPVYTGITRQSIKKRLSQHIRKGKPFVKAQSVVENLTRNQARAIETYKILYDGCSGENLILSISRNHRFYDDAIRWAKIFLGE